MPRASFRIEVVLILCFVALFSCFASAQGDPGTGLPAFGTFNSGAIDTINLGNLNIHVQVPLFRKKGRNLDVGLQILHDNTLYRPKYRNSAYTWDQDTLLGHEIWGVGVTTGGVGGSITFTPQSFSSQDQTCFDGVGYRDYQHFADFVFIDANGTNHSFGGAYVAIPSFCVTPQSTTGYSGDGYILHVTIDDSGNFTDKRVIDPAGNVMDYVAGTITDPNGNTISGSGTLTDTTGSTPLSFSGTALTSTFSYPNPSGGDPENITTTFSNAFTLQTNFQCPGIPDINPQGAGGTYLTTGVSLPDGTSYAFTYESTNGTYPSNVVTGRIHSITLPSGGVITYTYSGGTNGINCRDGSPATLTKQTPDGTWTYNHYYTATDQFHGLWTTKVTDPQGNDTVYTFGSVPTSETPQSSTLETQRIEYQGSQASGNWLRKTVTCYNGNFTGCETSNNLQGNSAIYVTRKDVYTYLKDAPAPSLSEVFYKVGSPQLVTQANEFDFGVNTGAAPTTTPVKATIITHANVGNNILTRPECIQVTAGSSPATCGTVTAATNSITNYLNYDSHGNVGTIQNLKSGSTYLSRAFTYFANGLVHTETDFRQTPTTYTYGNCNGSFPTQISKAGLSRQMTWNCNGGVVTSTTDENSKTTNYSYVNPDTGAGDPFWRLTQVTYPDGGRTTRTYNNTANHINITTAELIDAGHSLTTQTNFDVLHRPTLEMTTSDPGGTVYRATTYDELGRVKRSYNPTRCNPATTNCGESTWGYTEYSYDGLSRPIQVKNQDGTTISTSYQGRAAKVQDEGNGTQRVTRISQSDALGRVTSVCEVASSSGTPTACGQDLAANGYLTTYSYDALGNLTAVNQAGVNQRQFYYDGLSRLTNASNPESGAITYNYDADSLCATPNSFAGELVSKLDARGVRTCMQYDTLNHLTQKTYSDGTPTVTYNYGESSALGVTLTNTAGRRSSETTGGPNPTGSAFSYDSMGRVVTNSQCTPFNCASNGHYDLSYTYNLDGSVHTANNSQVTLTYGYDNAGQLGSVASSLSGGTHPGNLFTNASYGPLGLSQVSLGNGLTETRYYNSRGWLQSQYDAHGYGVEGKGSVIISGTLAPPQHLIQPATQSSATVTISGGEREGWIWSYDPDTYTWTSTTIWDYGVVSLNVGGYPVTSNYDSSSTPYSLAADLANKLTSNPNSPATAYVSWCPDYSQCQMVLTSRAAASWANYGLSGDGYSQDSDFLGARSSFDVITPSQMSGGQDYQDTIVYDSGTTTITVNNHTTPYTWSGSTTTAASIAWGLCRAINNDGGAYVYASTNGTLTECPLGGTTISLKAKVPGGTTNYTLTASSPSPQNSFSVSCPGFSSCGTQNGLPIAHLNGGLDPPGTINSFAITAFAPNGNIMSANDLTNGNWSYTYDDFNRLKTGVGNNGSGCSETYDRYGNRTAQAAYNGSCNSPNYNFDAANRINNYCSGTSGRRYGFDAAGNMTDDCSHTYTYDAENRIVKVDGGSTANYVYDAEGHRVRRTGTAENLDYLYDLSDRAVTLLNASTGGWSFGEIFAGARHLATYSGGVTYFPLTDWLGTTRVQARETGDVSQTCTSLPFGDSLNCNWYDPGHLHFTGKERDSESGLDNFGGRYLSSTIGRMQTPDPTGLYFADPRNPQSLNLYSYVLNNPMTFTDPSGLECVWDDGSYDSADDKNTGGLEKCSDAGGQWIDPKAFSTLGLADWSSQANSEVANIAQQLGTVTTTVMVNGSTARVPTMFDAIDDLLSSSAAGILGDGLNHMIFSSDNMPDPYRLFTTRYCGPGGVGQTSGVLDPACKVHDDCFTAAGLSAKNNAPGSQLSLTQALAAQACNQALYDFARSHPNEPGSKAAQYWLTKGDVRPFGHLAPGTEAVPW